MPHAGQEIHGPDRYRLRLVETGAETNGERLEMEATYGEAGALPPAHFHPSQDEAFEVLDGAVLTGDPAAIGPFLEEFGAEISFAAP